MRLPWRARSRDDDARPDDGAAPDDGGRHDDDAGPDSGAADAPRLSDDVGSAAAREGAPAPDDPAKPSSPPRLHRATWRYALRRALRESMADQITDLAAALTFYAVLALAPALIALVSLLALIGQSDAAVDAMIDIGADLAPPDAVDQVRTVVEQVTERQAAGLGLVLGLAGALWSASGFVGAFGRAMNRIYEIDEGRPVWKLRPQLLLVTLVALAAMALVALGLVVSGPVAGAVGRALGLGDVGVTVWGVVKWPVVLAVVVMVVAVLYYATPNVRQPRFRWISLGAVVAIVVWAVASFLFALYVSRFSSYDATYGALAGVIVLLLWLWISNLALLLGAEVDAEVERARQLQAGIVAEEVIQLPPRDASASRKRQEKAERDVERGRELRETVDAGDQR